MTGPQQPLDILYVGILPPHPGGAPLSNLALLSGFARFGHRVRALAPIPAAALSDHDLLAERHPEMEIMRFPVPYMQVGPNAPPTEAYRRAEGEAIAAALPPMIAARRPDVVMIGRESFAWHVPDIVDAHGLTSVLRAAGGTTIGIAQGSYPPDLAKAYLARMGRTTRRVAPARHLADILQRLGIGDVAVIPNAIDLRRFAPGPKDPALQRRLKLADDDIVVMLPGVLKAVKRPLDIVRSAQQALRRDRRLVYVIVGDGSLRAEMETACEAAGVADRFRFTGWVDHSAMPAYFNLADIVLMATEGEGLARVWIEAQACGRTLVASDFPSVFEVMTPGENGLVFRIGDIDDLTEKTLQATDPALRAALGRRARARMERAHDIDRAVAAYLELFADAIDDFHATRRRETVEAL